MAKVEGRSHQVVLNTLRDTRQLKQILCIYHCLSSSYLTITVCSFLEEEKEKEKAFGKR